MEHGWASAKGAELENLSMAEIGMMLKDGAWQKVSGKWEVDAQKRLKLEVMQRLLGCGSMDRCMDVKCKRLRRMLAMLGGGTAALRIETGRWNGLKREERICRQYTMGEIEDEEHFC